MSVISSSSLASGRNPESSYCDSSTSDCDHCTPSPPVQQDSHDEYTPTRKYTHSSSWTTPSQRSHTASISSSTHEALDRLYKSALQIDLWGGFPALPCNTIKWKSQCATCCPAHKHFGWGEPYTSPQNVFYLTLFSSWRSTNTVLGLIWGPSMWIVEETFSIVCRLLYVIGDPRWHQFVVTATWHTSFDARKWLLLPDVAVLRDFHDFVQGVIDARKDPTRPQIHTFRSK